MPCENSAWLTFELNLFNSVDSTVIKSIKYSSIFASFFDSYTQNSQNFCGFLSEQN